LEDNSDNKLGNLMDNEECNPEFIRKQSRISRKNKNVQKKNQKQELNCDGGSEECDVELESDENNQLWDNNDRSNNLNKSRSTTEESVAAFTLHPEGVSGELNSQSAYKEFVENIP